MCTLNPPLQRRAMKLKDVIFPRSVNPPRKSSDVNLGSGIYKARKKIVALKK